MGDYDLLGNYGNWSVGDTIRGGIDSTGNAYNPALNSPTSLSSSAKPIVSSGEIPKDYYGMPINDTTTYTGSGYPGNLTPGWEGLATTINKTTSNVSSSGGWGGGTMSYGGGVSTVGNQTQTTTSTPTQPMPVLTKSEPYTNPEWDKNQIKAYAQEDAALGISEARDALYNGINKIVAMQGNPTAQAAALRDALKGHGAAIAQVMRGANKEALNRYQVQYQNQINEAMTRFNAGKNDAYQKYQAEMQAYLNTMKRTATTGTGSGVSSSGGWGTGLPPAKSTGWLG